MRSKLITVLIMSSVLALSVPVEALSGVIRVSGSRHGQRVTVKVRSLPRGHQRIVVAGRTHYFHAGAFYRKAPSGYVVVAAPVGARIRVLPRGYTAVLIGGISYYHYYGTYYRHDPAAGVYVVVESPVELPAVDVLRLVNGEVLEGRFVSGDETSIRFEVGEEIHRIPLEQIVSIGMATPGLVD